MKANLTLQEFLSRYRPPKGPRLNREYRRWLLAELEVQIKFWNSRCARAECWEKVKEYADEQIIILRSPKAAAHVEKQRKLTADVGKYFSRILSGK